jgi:hypothetical protein
MMSRNRIVMLIQALAVALLLAVAGVQAAVSAPVATACQHAGQALPVAPDSAEVDMHRHVQIEVCPCAGLGFALVAQPLALQGTAEARDWMPAPPTTVTQRAITPDTPPPIA